MTTITPQDRKAVDAFLRLDDPVTEEALCELLARHRLAAIEQAAKIADRHDTGDCTREDMEARRIAGEIRALSEWEKASKGDGE